MDFVIRGAQVLNGQGGQVRDVYVHDEKIADPFDSPFLREIEGEGLCLLPGVIDGHVHFREPGASYKEDWPTGSLAAAAGGVTTVLDMPNTLPPVLSQLVLDEKRRFVQGRSFVDYGFFAGTQGDLQALKAMNGFCAIKVYMGSSTGDLLLDNLHHLEQVFKLAVELDKVVVVHAESEKRIKERQDLFEGDQRAAAYAECRDAECARIATDAAVTLAEKTGARLHIAHLSSAAELDLLRMHHSNRLSCEVTPHHLLFSMDMMQDAFLKMNPPLRPEPDRLALWEGISDGTVTCLATDHAPHTLEEKNKPIFEAPAGVPGVEFLLPLILNAVSHGQLSLPRAVQLLAEGPARVFGLSSKAYLEPGFDADMVLVDLNRIHTIVRSDVRSKCGWSPYEGRSLQGWPVQTFVRGQMVFSHGHGVGNPIGKEI